MRRVCFESAGTWPIKLTQVRRDSFTVTYGAQVDTDLTYGEAAAKLGEAIMHRAACDGQLDNREKNESGRADYKTRLAGLRLQRGL